MQHAAEVPYMMYSAALADIKMKLRLYEKADESFLFIRLDDTLLFWFICAKH